MSISLRLGRALFVAVLGAVLAGLSVSAVAAAPLAADDGILGPESGRCPQIDRSQLRTVEVLPLRGGFVDPPVAAQVADIIELAEREGSELVVLQYASAGGVSSGIDALVARVASSEVPVAVLVGPLGTGAEAQGAAGLLWLSAHVRAVSADASVGPLAPADLVGTIAGFDERAWTIDRLREIGVADPAAVADELASGTLDAQQLMDRGLVDVAAQSLEPLLVELDGMAVATASGSQELRIRACEVEVRFHSLGLVRRVLHAATTGPFVYLLLVLGIGMLLFELFQPGFGVAGLAGIVMGAIGVFGLFVLPVTWWAVALVVLGLLLYALDTAIAGFGPWTAAATVAFAVGSARFYDADALALNGWLVAATTLTVAVFFVFVMTSLLRAQAGPEGVRVEDLVGRPGIVRSVLNPEGHVYIDGALWRARWTGDARRAKVGTPVRVHAVDGAVVLVEPFEADEVSGRVGDLDVADGDTGAESPTNDEPKSH